jgi:glycosyltransferase involved in cell wall biosynthesis
MRLLFVTGSLVHGGAERHTITLSNRLAERGHECHAVYVKDDPSQLARLRGAASVHCLDARRYLDFGALRGFASLVRRLEPSVVLAANPYALMYAALALRAAASRAPLAVTFHTTLVAGAREQLKMLWYRPFFWRSDCTVFVAERQRRHWRRRQVFGRRNLVIYNGVDLEHWQPLSADSRAALRSALGFEKNELVVALCAELRPEKNPVQLVDALARLRGRGLAARALLVGDGEMRPAVEARARELGVAAAVTITGLQSDVRPFLAASDVLAVPSRTEALSLAAIEAMACGVPVVHSDVGGAAEIVYPGENGFLFRPGDGDALARRLAELADPALRSRMGRHARDTVAARFGERAMVERYETLLLELETARRRKHGELRKPAGAH